MASFPPAERRDDGFATPAALVFGLALAMLATAMVARSVMLLKSASADLDRTVLAYVLDGAQLEAAATMIRSGAGGPYRWAMNTDAGWAEVLAEPEDDKLSPAAAAEALPASVLGALGVGDGDALRQRLRAADDDTDLARLDTASGWRACGRSVVSPFGQKRELAWAARQPPAAARDLPAWRVGELWRMRITMADGWRDERIVRFTGDARHPVAVVTRKLSRSQGGQDRCDELLAGTA